MAKSMVALLLGVAAADHPAFSVTRLAQDFVPGLRHTAYGETTVRDLLHMTSGVVANDALLLHDLHAQRLTGDKTVLGAFNQSPTKAGAHFRYSCGE